MLRYIGRRLLVAIPTLLLVITAAFFMMRAAPGSPFDGDRKLSPEIEANVLAQYGMNKPVGQQYVDYLVRAAQGDLGPSLKYRDKTVLDILKENYRPSLTLGVLAIGIASVIGVSLGVLAALRQNRFTDNAVMSSLLLRACHDTGVDHFMFFSCSNILEMAVLIEGRSVAESSWLMGSSFSTRLKPWVVLITFSSRSSSRW